MRTEQEIWEQSEDFAHAIVGLADDHQIAAPMAILGCAKALAAFIAASPTRRATEVLSQVLAMIQQDVLRVTGAHEWRH